MENKYIFSISYQNNRILSDSYKYGHDLSIVCIEEDDRPPHCYFTSPHLSKLEEPKEIWARALSLITLYNGVSNLNFNPENEIDDISDLKIVRMYIWENNKDITPFDKNDIIQSYAFDDKLILDEKRLAKKNRNAYLINLAKSEKDILYILLQLGNGLNWVNLYSIYDTVKTFSVNINKKHFETVITNSGHTTTNLNAFTGTANNFGILGVDARHGELGFGTPKKTLTLKESQKIILSLCNSYIDLKYY